MSRAEVCPGWHQTWVPRPFCIPGRRIKLYPDDYYVLGDIREGVDARKHSLIIYTTGMSMRSRLARWANRKFTTFLWEAHAGPDFGGNTHATKACEPFEEMKTEGYVENWVCHKSSAFGAKGLTVLPGQTVTTRDSAAYGMTIMQGH